MHLASMIRNWYSPICPRDFPVRDPETTVDRNDGVKNGVLFISHRPKRTRLDQADGAACLTRSAVTASGETPGRLESASCAVRLIRLGDRTKDTLQVATDASRRDASTLRINSLDWERNQVNAGRKLGEIPEPFV